MHQAYNYKDAPRVKLRDERITHACWGEKFALRRWFVFVWTKGCLILECFAFVSLEIHI